MDNGPIGLQRPWDRQFRSWIQSAREQGRDPNDVGDEKWSSPLPALEKHYFPLINEEATVLELGPGTGRYSRHLLARCKKLILLDYSEMVCEYLRDYFQHEPRVRVVHAAHPSVPDIADESVDAVIANGVFEHIYLEGFYRYFRTFARVMKPGAKGCFNFNNIMAKGGLERFVSELPEKMRGRSIFRFYHPETVEQLCTAHGLRVANMATSDHRFAFLTFEKVGI